MAHLLQNYESLDSVQINGMIIAAQQKFPYLECTSKAALSQLCDMMLKVRFSLGSKPTPIVASYEFLRAITQQNLLQQPSGLLEFNERDFIFAIKMFGLKVRDHGGVMQFLPNNEVDPREDEEIVLQTREQARKLEYYVSAVHKRTKIQTNQIESAKNRLLREWREIELAKLFTRQMDTEGVSIGQAREFLRKEYEVKDHEFVRIRQHAIDLGLLKSKRNITNTSRRITLEPEVMAFVETLVAERSNGSPSDAVNQAMRDLYQLTNNKPLPSINEA